MYSNLVVFSSLPVSIKALQRVLFSNSSVPATVMFSNFPVEGFFTWTWEPAGHQLPSVFSERLIFNSVSLPESDIFLPSSSRQPEIMKTDAKNNISNTCFFDKFYLLGF